MQHMRYVYRRLYFSLLLWPDLYAHLPRLHAPNGRLHYLDGQKCEGSAGP
jgi:hypothetical protein